MPERLQLTYWDSGVFLAYISAEEGRVDTIGAILYHIKNNNKTKRIVTSVLAKVEVAYSATEKVSGVLSSDTERNIDALWNDDTVLALIEFHDGIAMDARALMRNAKATGTKLTPIDAIHLASAQSLGVHEFHTYDKRLLAYDRQLGFAVCEPYIAQPLLPLGSPMPMPKTRGRSVP